MDGGLDRLKRLAERVRWHLEQGSFAQAPAVEIGQGQSMDVALMARISLADVEHVLERSEADRVALSEARMTALSAELEALLQVIGE